VQRRGRTLEQIQRLPVKSPRVRSGSGGRSEEPSMPKPFKVCHFSSVFVSVG
jgi:hypothetical protein